jgi:hypothetical protein
MHRAQVKELPASVCSSQVEQVHFEVTSETDACVTQLRNVP